MPYAALLTAPAKRLPMSVSTYPPPLGVHKAACPPLSPAICPTRLTSRPMAPALSTKSAVVEAGAAAVPVSHRTPVVISLTPCLLYTSDAADERSSVDLG